MVRYHNFDIVFAEVPDEVTLALNLTRCPNRCPGCHSPHLRSDTGRVLDEEELAALLEVYGRSVTCVAFMGGDGEPQEVALLAEAVRRRWPTLRTAWYSGRAELPPGIVPTAFDYIKLGLRYSREEVLAEYADYPLITRAYDHVVNYLKTNYGMDLTLMGAEAEPLE